MSQEFSPDARLRFDPAGMEELPRSFYRRDTVRVARGLLGTWLARCHDGQWYGARIVETEAYLGAIDRAAHTWRGRRTKRVEPMYMDGGHLYVFFVYGMHHCANVVTRGQGDPEAVLLRAAEGGELCPPKLLSGPGRLCSRMGITIADSGSDLVGGNIRIFRGHARRPSVAVSPRIGVEYAAEARDWPLRFYDAASPAVSGPRNKPGEPPPPAPAL
jgi:DNA-3-methyladenine glycosylase